MKVRIRVLGSGTSSGVPTIGCRCAVCLSEDPRDKRLRPSILISAGEGDQARNVVIDTTPDFRAQMLTARIDRLDAVLFTHSHADHILGLDDIRPFNARQGTIPIHAAPETLDVIRTVFAYAFMPRKVKTYLPQLDLRALDGGVFETAGLTFEPIPVMHGDYEIRGFRFGNAAYLTDHSHVPDESIAKLGGLDVLFLDALRHRPHPTHTTVADAIEVATRIGAKRTFFTHMSHDLGHANTEATLPPGMFLAYDGLEIEVAPTA